MKLNNRLYPVVVVLFVTLCTILFMCSRLPSKESGILLNLLSGGNGQTFVVLIILFIILLIGAIIVYQLLAALLNWTAEKLDLKNVDMRSLMVINYEILGLSILFNMLFNVFEHKIFATLLNPIIIIGIIFSFLLMKNNKLKLNHVLHTLVQYVCLVVMNAAITLWIFS
ncbi:magnesium-transporting ATPase (P-type) [Staphylococcus auricularis]|nr:Uncharacterised protein [Staphylococcus auricularis]